MITEFDEVLKEEYKRKIALIGDPIKEMGEVNQKLRNHAQMFQKLNDDLKGKTDWREFYALSEYINSLQSLVQNSIILQNEAVKLTLSQPEEPK